MTLSWSENFSVHINSIDDQHKKFIEILNLADQAVTKMGNGTPKDEIAEIIKRLEDYAKFHFSYEEELFDKYDYPQKDIHKKEHDVFKEEMVTLKADFESGDKDITFKVISFLENWLINHICYSDKKYSDFLIGKGLN